MRRSGSEVEVTAFDIQPSRAVGFGTFAATPAAVKNFFTTGLEPLAASQPIALTEIKSRPTKLPDTEVRGRLNQGYAPE